MQADGKKSGEDEMKEGGRRRRKGGKKVTPRLPPSAPSAFFARLPSSYRGGATERAGPCQLPPSRSVAPASSPRLGRLIAYAGSTDQSASFLSERLLSQLTNGHLKICPSVPRRDYRVCNYKCHCQGCCCHTALRLGRDIRPQDACDPCRFLTTTVAFHLGRDIGHCDISDPCCVLTPTTAFRLDRDIGHSDTSDPCRFLTPTAALLLDRDIRHWDACDPCCFLTTTATLRLDRDIRHRNTSNPWHFLTSTAAFHLVMDIGHHDTSNPCRIFTLTAAHFSRAVTPGCHCPQAPLPQLQ
ncbi:Hypothetical predicted protein [Scomber scombrus]|uniref:Uncharacterized protein n=1 Tax=Scomber scombrus TaxID=13677 RepID=A0AAV1P982_SCOSC